MRRVAREMFPGGVEYGPALRGWIEAIAVHLELDEEAHNGRSIEGVIGEAIRCGIRGVDRSLAKEAVEAADRLYWNGARIGRAIGLLPAVRDAARAWQIESPHETNEQARDRRDRERMQSTWRRQKQSQRERAHSARPPKPMTVEKIAALHDVSPTTAWRWREAGKVDPFTGAKVGDTAQVKKTCPPPSKNIDNNLLGGADTYFSSAADAPPPPPARPEAASGGGDIPPASAAPPADVPGTPPGVVITIPRGRPETAVGGRSHLSPDVAGVAPPSASGRAGGGVATAMGAGG